jgi:hypothetical protein
MRLESSGKGVFKALTRDLSVSVSLDRDFVDLLEMGGVFYCFGKDHCQ